MHQINSNTIPTILFNKFKKPTNNYPTNDARTNYRIPPFKLNKSKYRISIKIQLCGKIFQPKQKKATKDQYFYNRSEKKKKKCLHLKINLHKV